MDNAFKMPDVFEEPDIWLAQITIYSPIRWWWRRSMDGEFAQLFWNYTLGTYKWWSESMWIVANWYEYVGDIIRGNFVSCWSGHNITGGGELGLWDNVNVFRMKKKVYVVNLVYWNGIWVTFSDTNDTNRGGWAGWVRNWIIWLCIDIICFSYKYIIGFLMSTFIIFYNFCSRF